MLRKDGTPVTAAQLQANPRDAFIGDLHSYGASFETRWVSLGFPRRLHGGGQGGRRDAVQAAGERGVPARHGLPRVLLHGDR